MPLENVLGLINSLLPGFLSVYIFYSSTAFTTFSKQPYLPTIIFALIFSSISNALTGGLASNLSLPLYNLVLYGIAIVLGIIFSAIINHDLFHRLLRWLRVTKEMSYPSEWYGVFAQFEGETILYLKNGNRLLGTLHSWPTDPKNGHFILINASWLGQNEKDDVQLTNTEYIIIKVEDVEQVELLKEEK